MLNEMAFNTYLPPKFYQHDLEVTSVGRFGHIASKEVSGVRFNADCSHPYTHDRIARLALRTPRSVIVARLWEYSILEAADLEGIIRNSYISEPVPRDFVSVQHNKKTQRNVFVAAEELLERPSTMNRRTAHMLSLIGTACRSELVIDQGPVSDLISLASGSGYPVPILDDVAA